MNPEARAGTLLDSVEDCADRIIEMLDGEIICGAPLGLGKPNPLINAIYRRACRDQAIQLRIMTALSLERPTPDSELERRFLEPFVARHFGNYPELEYVADVRAGTVPGNVRISEFYFKSGSFLHVSDAQRNYVSSNYTHVARDMLDHGANLIVQMVARRTVDGVDRYSLSCNSDVTLDLVPLLREREAQGGAPFLMAGMVNNNLPFMYRDAMVEREFFDLIVENEQYHHRLFGVPNMPISDTDHMIGLRASALVRDGGTVQVGIGSLGDAFAYSTRLRHRNNDAWRATLDAAGADLATGGLISREGGLTPFRQGLYAGSEMFSGGLLELYGAGILSRRVYDHEGLQALVNEGLVEDAVRPEVLGHLHDRGIVASPLTEGDVELLRRFGIFHPSVELTGDGLRGFDDEIVEASLATAGQRAAVARHCLGNRLANGVLLHSAFFLGSSDFYARLREMDEEEGRLFCMTAVSKVNALYGDESLERLQRRHARFINTCMKMTLLGAAVSDGLEDGQVVSGVGGQYNFVAMAHALRDGRSILMLRSTRQSRHGLTSNIVWNYGHETIPRHLRDIVITEYGIADLRGKSDRDVIVDLLRIADSRFQAGLARQAIEAGKLEADFQLPEAWQKNRPGNVAAVMARARKTGLFPALPFGTDFTDEELELGKALRRLQSWSRHWRGRLRLLVRLCRPLAIDVRRRHLLERMSLARPRGMRQRWLRRLVAAALE